MNFRLSALASLMLTCLPVCTSILTATSATAATSLATSALPYMRYPSSHGDNLVFTAEGDLWRVSLASGGSAGIAQRLTTNAGEEIQSSISPDGTQVAFVASYDGVPEVYVMPLAGGIPRRLSFEATGSQVLGWSAAGEVMYSVQSQIGPNNQRVVKLVTPSTLARRTLPLHDVNEATLSSDGKTLFFTRLGLAVRQDNARHYRGGDMAQLWRYDIGSNQEARLLSTMNAVDKQPMWYQGRLYFISDRDGSDNLWSMKEDGSDAKQLTRERAFDVRNASLTSTASAAGKARIVYQLGGNVFAYDLASASSQQMSVQLPSDHEQMRERILKNPLDYLTSTALAANGERAVVTARGRLVLAGLSPSRRIDIPTPIGSRARDAVLSMDGKFVYTILDASGEQEIWRFAADGSDQGRALTKDGHMQRTRLALSPDGRTLAHTSLDGRIWLLDIATGKNDLISATSGHDVSQLRWSPDSHALAVVQDVTRRPIRQVSLYDVGQRQFHIVTSDKYSAYAVAFSPDGQWLYLVGDRNFDAKQSGPWGDRHMGPYFEKRGKVYAYALQAGLRFPFQAKNELDSTTPATLAKNPAEKTETKPAKPASGIQFAGLSQRMYEVPLPAANYQQIEVDSKRLYLRESEAGRQSDPHSTIKTLSIDNSGATPEVFVADIADFDLSHDQKKILLQRHNTAGTPQLLIVDAAAKAGDLSKAGIALGGWQLALQPQAEWRQMFDDAWRMQRDYLFDPKMRGLDWQKVRDKYAAFLPQVRDKYELNDLLAIMMSELGTLHSQIAPGEVRKFESNRTPAFLGAALERVANGYKIAHIYRHDSELPNEAAPLAQSGQDFQDGDVITHVNHRAVGDVADIAQLLENQVGQQVLLHYVRGQQHKTAIVQPVNAERNVALRYTDWEWSRQQQVEQASQGKIGYLHLRAMTTPDLNIFVREFYAQINREGLIIDVRRNSGGNIDSWIIEKLLRRTWGFWQSRDGSQETHPQQSFRGHLVVLADELTYSDGETFAAATKALGLGPVIGKRTAGAGVWLSDENSLLDKGRARAAESAQFMIADGRWIIEGVGVAPDIEVANLPHASFEGKDAQLEAAIQWLQEKRKQAPIPALKAQTLPLKNP